MTLRTDLEDEVGRIFRENWTCRDGTVVPDDASIKLGNDAVKLDATVLYADLHDSTGLVDHHKAHFSAEIYKTYLVCAARIIREFEGTITAYDGDRIMAVFIGGSKNTSAVKAALKIHWAVDNIIHVKLAARYPNTAYRPEHVVGIDTCKLFIAKTGIRNFNDLVWVGKAANYAAKLSNLNQYQTYITDRIYNNIANEAKYSKGVDMWTALNWNSMNGDRIYGSRYSWAL